MATAEQIRDAIGRSAADLVEREPDVNFRCSCFVARLAGWLHDDPDVAKVLGALLDWPCIQPAEES